MFPILAVLRLRLGGFTGPGHLLSVQVFVYEMGEGSSDFPYNEEGSGGGF